MLSRGYEPSGCVYENIRLEIGRSKYNSSLTVRTNLVILMDDFDFVQNSKI